MLEGLRLGTIITDMVQIGVLWYGIYMLIRFVLGTRIAPILLGFCVLVALFLLFAYLLGMDVLARIVFYLLIFMVLSMIVVFQQEIRRMLELLSGQRWFGRQTLLASNNNTSAVDILCNSLVYLSQHQIGALVAIERGISLRSYEASGVLLRAVISQELLISIFTPPLPLHDGGVVIRDGVLTVAHALFPVSNQITLAGSGMRHRAAVGLSEETDALVVVVSEETGRISIAHNGKLHRFEPDRAEKLLLRWLRKAMPIRTPRAATFGEWLFKYTATWFNGKHLRTQEVSDEIN